MAHTDNDIDLHIFDSEGFAGTLADAEWPHEITRLFTGRDRFVHVEHLTELLYQHGIILDTLASVARIWATRPNSNAADRAFAAALTRWVKIEDGTA